MTDAADGGTIDVTPARPTEHRGPGHRWSLAGTRPQRLASRLAIAALGVGVVGGMATAFLSVIFWASEVSPAARNLAIGLPLVLAAMIGWRLAATAGYVGWAPSGRWIGWLAMASVVLTGVVQGWSEIGRLGDDVAHNAGVALGVAFYGSVFGLMPAVAAIVVAVPALLLVRACGLRLTLPAAYALLTVLAMAVTAAFALWVTTEMRTEILTGMATALAGTGAVLTARWCLQDRQV